MWLSAPLSCLAVVALLLSTHAASADVIDGNWCFTDGRHISIKGPYVVTPAGTEMTGDYTRHSFVYTVPDSEPGAGSVVSMTLMDQETVYLRPNARSSAAKSPVEVWRRCDLIS